MSRTVSESDSFDATVTAISDGEALDAAHVGLPADPLANRTRWLYNRTGTRFEVASDVAQGAPVQAITSTITPTDVTGSSLTFTGLVAGDRVEVEAAVFFNGDGASTAQVSVAIVDGATTDTDFSTNYGGMATNATGTTNALPATLLKYRAIATGGSVVVKLQGFRFSGGTDITVQRFSIRARVTRAA